MWAIIWNGFFLNELSVQKAVYLILSHLFIYIELSRMIQRKDDSLCVEVLSFSNECAGTEVWDSTLYWTEGISNVYGIDNIKNLTYF